MLATPDRRFQTLQLNALMAFSDACTIPTLTPTCPYFRLEETGPSCGEECRSALGEMGVDRGEREVAVLGGMIMTGRPLPIEVAAGSAPFDATRELLLEQGMPLGQRSTGTLLLELRSHATTTPGSRLSTNDAFFRLISELERRTVPVKKVMVAVAAPAIAASIARLIQGDNAYGLPGWARAFQVCQAMVPESAAAYERWFCTRAEEWLARLLAHDTQGFLEWTAPPSALLANMPSPVPEGEGKWVWDRFTRASLDEWSTTSLLMEWRFLRGSSIGDISPRLLGARTFDVAEIAEAALERVADGIEPNDPTPRDLSSNSFVDQAIAYLEAGDHDKAAEIFAAIVVVNPADGDALNNLGLCLLPSQPRTALKVLDRASTLASGQPAINMANRAFARHLLGQDEEAFVLLGQASAAGDALDVWMWVEEQCGEFHIQRFDSVGDYLTQLREHISDRSGEHTATDGNLRDC